MDVSRRPKNECVLKSSTFWASLASPPAQPPSVDCSGGSLRRDHQPGSQGASWGGGGHHRGADLLQLEDHPTWGGSGVDSSFALVLGLVKSA